MKKLSTKEFIDKASIKHNGRYGYDFVNYVNSQTPVIITCPIHGNFEQKPAKHLLGQGCPECNGTKKKQLKNLFSRLDRFMEISMITLKLNILIILLKQR